MIFSRCLNLLEKQSEGLARPVLTKSVTKIMACEAALTGDTISKDR
ncbi:hypothetical protein GSE88_20985 [Escherichia coli]|nr:hypothetical protein [Salmonella enterica subsp. enterica serovar Kisangani]EFH3166737.1 hypothetical protein [Escherichia coli]EGO6758402.1 hypothetical protein [Escherichia coli]